MIDYGVAMILIPAMLFGTIIGMFLNKIFPDILLLIVMAALLMMSFVKLWKKAKATSEKERDADLKERFMDSTDLRRTSIMEQPKPTVE